MPNIFLNVRGFKYLLLALSMLIIESKAFCFGYPCGYLQPPWPQNKWMHFPKPSYQQYPSFYYYQYSQGNVPAMGSLSPSNYPFQHFQRPPMPLVIFVTKLPDQSSGSNQQAVQVLTPTSVPEPVASSSAAPTTETKPAYIAPSVSTGNTQTPSPILSTPPSTSPQQATTSSPTATSQTLSANVNSTLSPTPPTKPSAPTTLPNFKPLDTTAPNNQRSLDSISWKDKWQQAVYTTTGTKLCQNKNHRGTFTKEANDICNNACQEAYDHKLDWIGLTDTGIILLGGSCHQQVQINRSVCLCNLRLGREFGQFLVANKE